MKKEKQSNRPLIISILSIITCVVLLIGATMAWFTDTETNTGNRIQAGTLDVELWMYTGSDSTIPTIVGTDSNWTQITDDSNPNSIFGEAFENWEPGDEADMYFAVVNKGSLDVNYTLDLVVTDDDLADAIQFKATGSNTEIATPTDDYATISSVIEVDNTIPIMTTTTTHTLDGTSSGSSKDTMYITMNLKFDESAGNTYQGLAFAMDVILTATQTNVDEDVAVVKAYDIEDIKAAETDQTVILMNDITSNKALTIDKNVNFDLNGYTLTVESFKMETDAICTVDIADGEIIATGGNIDILIENGTINADDSIFAVDADYYKVTINASLNTFNIIGTTQFFDITTADGVTVADINTKIQPTILANTRVVGNVDNDIELNVDSGTEGVIIDTLSTGVGTLSVSGTGIDGVTILVDGETPVLTASEQFIADLESAVTGETVTLTDNVIIDSNLYIYGKAISIDMNGFDLTVNGVLVIDYSNVTTLGTDVSKVENWCSLVDGTILECEAKYGSYYPVYTKTQESKLYAKAMFISAGSGSFGINNGLVSGEDTLPAKVEFQAAFNFSVTGTWQNAYSATNDGTVAIVTDAYDESDFTSYLAGSTIKIGTELTE